MELWQEILSEALQNESIKHGLTTEECLSNLLDSICYKALLKIKEILENDRLNDAECFFKIEEIVCLLEDLGSNAGNRHDFG